MNCRRPAARGGQTLIKSTPARGTKQKPLLPGRQKRFFHFHDYQEMPTRVEYGLTELGKEMLPIIDALADFGNYYKSVLK